MVAAAAWLAGQDGSPLGTGKQPTTWTSGGSAQECAGEPGEMKGGQLHVPLQP